MIANSSGTIVEQRSWSQATPGTASRLSGWAINRQTLIAKASDCPVSQLRSADQKVTERLARLHSQTDPASPTGQPSDVPLKLDTTSRWVTEAVYLTDIIEELVDLTVRAENPFSVDHDYLDTLSLEESVLLSGALVEFLSALWMRGGKFADKGGLIGKAQNSLPDFTFNTVWPDIQTLVSRHTKELCQLHKAKT